MERVTKLKLNGLRRSTHQLPQADTAIYIADSFGELGLFYKASPAVCIGGSFGKIGGHNPLEAAHFGCAILFGPDMHNFAEMSKNILAAGAARQVQTGEELANVVSILLQNPVEQTQLSDKAKDFAANEQHVIDRVMTELQPLLNTALG